MKLSAKAQATRQRILEAANELFYQQGYNATGLEKVIKAAGVTKGNFYYYFKSKEKLAVATLDWQFEKTMQAIQQTVLAKHTSPLDKLLGIVNYIVDRQRIQQANGQACGCYFGNFALELSTVSQEVKDKVKTIFNDIADSFRQLLQAAQQQGEISTTIDPHIASTLILSQLEGAVLLNKANQEMAVLEHSMDFIKQYLTQEYSKK